MTNSNDSTDESSLTCLLVLVEMAASKLENNDNLMKLLTLAQLDASKLKYENEQLQEDLEFERSENGWVREFLDRMGQKCGTKDCSSLAAYVEELESENAKLLELNNIRILQTQHCEDLDAENAKLRNLAQRLYGFAYDEYPDSAELNFADELRELGIEVKTDEDW